MALCKIGVLVWCPPQHKLPSERREFVTKTMHAQGLVLVGSTMPCGASYSFKADALPLENATCRCGDKRHTVVEWREAP